MAAGRRHHGRSQHLDDRVTRTVGRTLAAQSPGRGFWDRSHRSKTPFTTFCEAMKTERANYRNLFNRFGGTDRRGVYSCTSGRHHLIVAPAHWHIGRPM